MACFLVLRELACKWREAEAVGFVAAARVLDADGGEEGVLRGEGIEVAGPFRLEGLVAVRGAAEFLAQGSGLLLQLLVVLRESLPVLERCFELLALPAERVSIALERAAEMGFALVRVFGGEVGSVACLEGDAFARGERRDRSRVVGFSRRSSARRRGHCEMRRTAFRARRVRRQESRCVGRRAWGAGSTSVRVRAGIARGQTANVTRP
jgi:hypothetical protein